jgi:hypothetical protein
MGKDSRGAAKREQEWLDREAAQRCKQCLRFSGRLRHGRLCPRCVQIKEGQMPANGSSKAAWPFPVSAGPLADNDPSSPSMGPKKYKT